jgi:FKBP-type peptidyl-prolyl cis-trans isomerase FklB
MLGVLALVASAQTAPAPAPTPSGFDTRLQAISYAVGLDMVRNFRSQDVNFDVEQLVRGIRDASTDGTRRMSDAEAKLLVAELEGQVRSKLIAARRQAGELNAKKSDEFLKQQAAAPGMIATPSGLLYRIDREGKGAKAVESSLVNVHYSGMLADGSTFDASPPGKPAQLKMSALVQGWREALKLMPAGSKWHVIVPPKLAYGERGAGSVIGPNQALVFDIDLVSVE